MTYAYIGLGSNAGASRRHLRRAAERLKKLPGARLTGLSPLYRSAPVGCPGRQRAYYNAAAELQTRLPPQRVFLRLRRLEQAIQKKPRAQNAARRLDADYLAHGACRLTSAALTLPHPRLYQRAFVLQPLDDLLSRASPPRPLDLARIRRARAQCRGQPLCRVC